VESYGEWRSGPHFLNLGSRCTWTDGCYNRSLGVRQNGCRLITRQEADWIPSPVQIRPQKRIIPLPVGNRTPVVQHLVTILTDQPHLSPVPKEKDREIRFSREVPSWNLIRRFRAVFITISVVLLVLYRRLLGQYFETGHGYLPISLALYNSCS
jgi:hypothetical protein